MAAAGWTAPHFTAEQGGRGLDRRSQAVVRAAFADLRRPAPARWAGAAHGGADDPHLGTPEQIARLVPPILDGRVGLVPAVQRAGRRFRPGRAHHPGPTATATAGSSPARRCGRARPARPTSACCSPAPNFDVPKHKGISWFAIPLEQPGVTIRPLREMTGQAVFNEVFLDEAVCDAADLVGGEGNGWAVTQTTLHFERTGIGAGGIARRLPERRPQGRHARAPGRRCRPRRAAQLQAGRRLPRRRRARPGARPDDRPVHPPGPGAPPHLLRDRALERPAGQGRGAARGRRVRGQHRQARARPAS